jgi:hypothetical protein
MHHFTIHLTTSPLHHFTTSPATHPSLADHPFGVLKKSAAAHNG